MGNGEDGTGSRCRECVVQKGSVRGKDRHVGQWLQRAYPDLAVVLYSVQKTYRIHNTGYTRGSSAVSLRVPC